MKGFKEWLWDDLTTDDDENPSIDPEEVDYDEFDRQFILDATEIDESQLEALENKYRAYCRDAGYEPVMDLD